MREERHTKAIDQQLTQKQFAAKHHIVIFHFRDLIVFNVTRTFALVLAILMSIEVQHHFRLLGFLDLVGLSRLLLLLLVLGFRHQRRLALLGNWHQSETILVHNRTGFGRLSCLDEEKNQNIKTKQKSTMGQPKAKKVKVQKCWQTA